jgi:mRNA interferase MazF
MVKPRQGDIFWVRFGDPGDSGPSGKRPAVVIQNDLLNSSNLNTTIVSLITSNLKLGDIPWNIELKKGMGNIPKSSVVVVSQVATVDKTRLLEKIGSLDNATVDKILDGCCKTVSKKAF